MKLKRFKKLDNRGATLLLVILCMFFVGIIAAMMLTVTLTNRKMKTVENMARENFYTAETAIDELDSALQEIAADSLSEAYQKLLTEYTATTDTDRPLIFRRDFTDFMYLSLSSVFGSDAAFESESMNFFSVPDDGALRWLNRPTIITDSANGKVTLKDVSIAYRDNDDYETSITTDIILTAEYPEFRANYKNQYSDDFVAYGIITDRALRNTLSGHAVVYSSVYAGGSDPTTGMYTGRGIYTYDGELDIFADKVITRTSIEANGNGKIVINGLNDANGLADIWVKNLIAGGNKNLTSSVNLDILGRCYVADDLSLESVGSNVKIKGEYYGYSTNNISASNRSGNAESSSAITINATGITLDLTELDKLCLYGKAYISASDSYGLGIDSTVAAELIEGESMTFKNLQAAYLLPGDCIIGIGHNPMTAEEYGRLTDPSLQDKYYIDLLQSQKTGGVRLGDYLRLTEPYRQVFVRYIDNTMVYLYLNFQNPDKASEYFVKYNEIYEDVTQVSMNTLYDEATARGSILINPSSLENTGNIITYSQDTGYSLYEKDKEYNDITVENMQMELAARYSGLSLALDETFTSIGGVSHLTDRLVDFSKLPGTGGIPDNIWLKLQEDASDGYYCITGEDITLDAMVKAIVIATGDVTVRSSFTGLIIAKGDIILEGNASVNADPDGIRALFANEEKIPAVEAIKKYFRIFDSTGTSGESGTNGGNNRVVITYENWRKN